MAINVADILYKTPFGFGGWNAYMKIFADILGYSQMIQKQQSNLVQIDYNDYMKAANERALKDWYKNVGIPQNRTIKYPEFSYAGAIRSYDAGISRAYISNDTAYSNAFGSLPYRGAGLYGIGSRLSRYL